MAAEGGPMSQLLRMMSAIVLGVGAVAALFVAANRLTDLLPERSGRRVRPWVFVAPALLLVTAVLVIPLIRTVYLSFFDARGDDFLGFDNYEWAFTTDEIVTVFRNNGSWIVGVTALSTGFGLLMAMLADRVKHESLAKSFIFLPMAISFVGASVIWRFVYAFKPAGTDQIGLLNAVWVGLGGEPRGWLLDTPVNTFLLMVVLIWIQTGFAMVVLSAAIKGVPTELIEAARVDGANEFQIFRRVIVPTIKSTIAVVATTTIILVLKVYDIVKVMTNGEFETNVIANEMFDQAFRFRQFGRGSALAVVLFVAVVPVMIYNVRRLRAEERLR
jgi:alpha-glucoside transport system permease protein